MKRFSNMLPKEPPRRPQLGFIYHPPYRIQGISIAGEESFVQIPELDVVFDIGRAPRSALISNFVALTHGHMDHSAGLAYYFSQRVFQGMGTGTVLCHKSLEKPIHNLMRAWIDIEAQKTPYNVIPLEHEQEFQIKNNIFLRAFHTNHTAPSLGFVVVEKRSKLKEDLVGLPQEQLLKLKAQGQEITRTIEIPLVCYVGDTAWGPHFDRQDVLNAKILITESTFLETEHKKRAHIGKHLHLDDIVKLTQRSNAQAIILTHLSRRTHIGQARKWINSAIDEKDKSRVHILMDSRNNRSRYEQQLAQTTQD